MAERVRPEYRLLSVHLKERIRAFVVGLSSVAVLFFGCQKTPITGRTQLLLVPEETMVQLALDTYSDMKKSYRVIQGTSQARMIQRVGERLARATESLLKELQQDQRLKYMKWEFTLFDADSVVNAFCLPGGKIGVFTGILPIAQSEEGLAVVLGHEIAHAIARHGAERMSHLLAVYMGGIALSVALEQNPEETQALFMMAYNVGTGLGVLAYSRKHELEADRIGLILMAKAGYDPREAVRFWERMEQMAGNPGVPEFLSTHPSHQKRKEALKKALPEAMKYYQGGS